jgi:hypothetical protein
VPVRRSSGGFRLIRIIQLKQRWENLICPMKQISRLDSARSLRSPQDPTHIFPRRAAPAVRRAVLLHPRQRRAISTPSVPCPRSALPPPPRPPPLRSQLHFFAHRTSVGTGRTPPA